VYDDLQGAVQVKFTFGAGLAHPLAGARHPSRSCIPLHEGPPVWRWPA
jgi:hypothetical protein